ncbi:hypothetical protein KJ762_07960 [bacterium]|nr:hypothetical protein [bacterium]MBU1634427.1 hypothetical protein [bacterium]MBU1875476.1 hypothetical protein [bacterium]
MKKFKLSVKEYQRILKSIQLREISLKSIRAEKSVEYLEKNLELNIKDSSKYIPDDKNIGFIYHFSLNAKSPDKDKPAVKIGVDFSVEYSNPKNIPIDPEFYDIFPNASLKYIVWPYFREIVQNTVSRMNLPPLTLPTIML